MGKAVELAPPASVLFPARAVSVPLAEVSPVAAKTPELTWMKSRRVTPAFRFVGMVHLAFKDLPRVQSSPESAEQEKSGAMITRKMSKALGVLAQLWLYHRQTFAYAFYGTVAD
jgi:hypothetical protein